MSKSNHRGALPEKSYYALVDAAEIAGCKPCDLLHCAVLGSLELLVGVPDGVAVRVYDEQANSVREPFLLKPVLLVLSQSQCLKIELQGKTQLSDFSAGYLLEQTGKLRKILPSYGLPALRHLWVYWRLFDHEEVCLLTIAADNLFMRHADLVKLMEPATKSRLPDQMATKAPRSAKPDASADKAEESGSADIATANDSGSTGSEGPETTKSPTKMVQKSRVDVVPAAVAKAAPAGPVILRLKEVMSRTGLSRSTIYDRRNPTSTRHDPSFPQQVVLGNDAGAVGWIESEIDAWIQSRIGSSRK